MDNLNYLIKNHWKILIAHYAQGFSFFIPMIVDILYLSRFSPEGIGGIGILTPIFSIFFLIISSLARGAVVIGQKLNKNSSDIPNELKSIVISNAITSNIFAVILSLMIFSLVRFLDRTIWFLEPETFMIMTTYLRWVFPKVLLSGVMVSASTIFKISFKPQYTTVVVIVTSTVNVLLNTLFLLTTITDSSSAAKYLGLATAIAVVTGQLVSLSLIMKNFSFYFKVRIKDLDLLKNAKNQMRTGIPFLLSGISSSITFNVLMAVIARKGNVILAGFTLVENMSYFIISWGQAVAYWVQSFLSLAVNKNSLSISSRHSKLFASRLMIYELITLGMSTLIILFYSSDLFFHHSTSMAMTVWIFMIANLFIQLGRTLNLSFIPSLIIFKKNRFVITTTLLINYFYYLPALLILRKIGSYNVLFIPLLIISDELIRAVMNGIKIKKVINA